MTNVSPGDEIEIQHSPGPNGAHTVESIEDNGFIINLKNGGTMYRHELDKDYITHIPL